MPIATLQKQTEFDTLVADNDNGIEITEGRLGIAARKTFAQMKEHCETHLNKVEYVVRGAAIIDTVGNIGEQLKATFKAIDTDPAIEYMSFKVTEAAKESGQRYQEVMLAYVDNGVMPKIEGMNKQSQVTIITDDGITDAGGMGAHSLTLKAPWGSGAGDGSELGDLVAKIGKKKFFALGIGVLDVTDANAADLIADMNTMQAFGASQANFNAISDVMAASGAPARMMDSAVQQMVEIKTMRNALTDAGTSVQAAPVAAALAMRVEALSIALPAMQQAVPAPVMQHMTQQIDAIKSDMGASHMARAIEVLATSLPVSNNIITTQVAKIVETIQTNAVANNMTVADAVSIAQSPNAPKDLKDPIKDLIVQLAKPEVLPMLERNLPEAQAQALRALLTLPPLQAAAAVPIMPETIIPALGALAQKSGNDSLKDVTAKLGETATSATPALIAQGAADNLRGMMYSNGVSQDVKNALAPMIPQIEAMAVQLRGEYKQRDFGVGLYANNDRRPEPLSPWSPIAQAARQFDMPIPSHMSPSPWMQRSDSYGHPYNNPSKMWNEGGSGQQQAQHWSAHADNNNYARGTGTHAANGNNVDVSKSETVSKKTGANGKPCAGCFNTCASCGALSTAAVERMSSRMGVEPSVFKLYAS